MSLLSPFQQRLKQYNYHVAFLLVGAWNLLAICPARAESGDLNLPDDVTRALHAVISASAHGHVRSEPRYFSMGRGPNTVVAMGKHDEQWRKDFDELLRDLAELATDDVVRALKPHEGRRIECNFVAIALDRQKRPEAYDKLIAYYGVPYKLGHVAPLQRQLAHTEARHRLFWEYCTLAPADERIIFIREKSLPTYALSVIHEEASLPVLAFDFRLQQMRTLLSAIDHRAVNEMESILRAIAASESSLALEWLLQCVALTETCHPYSTLDFPSSKFPEVAERIGRKELTSFRELATALLAKPVDRFSNQRETRWRQVLESYPVDQLSAADKSVIREALSTYEQAK